MPKPLILASASAIRTTLLRNAGLDFEIIPADVDETALKNDHQGSPQTLAERLAEAKARQVAAEFPNALVLGADQVLDYEGELLNKPPSLQAACDQLRHLRGGNHQLISAACLIDDGRSNILCDTAKLTMRTFSDKFLDDYIERAGESVLSSVGAYQLESIGCQLFDHVEGDYFTILGLPLLKLLALLRTKGIITA